MKYISINSHKIRGNAIRGTNEAPIRIACSKNDKNPVYAREIKIIGKARLVYSPHKKLISCGARMVLVCDDIRIVR